MLRRVLVAAFVVLLFPLLATADDQVVPIKSASDVKGTWFGPYGSGPFGYTTLGTVRITVKEDGTFTSAIASTTGGGAYRGATQGTFEVKPDGTAANSGALSTGTWRLFDVNGKRVIRAEGRNRANGQPIWSEMAQEQ